MYNIKENGFVTGRHFTIRLFRNLKGVRFSGKIHEQVIPLGTLAYPGMSIYHFGYDLDPETMKKEEGKKCSPVTADTCRAGRGPDSKISPG